MLIYVNLQINACNLVKQQNLNAVQACGKPLGQEHGEQATNSSHLPKYRRFVTQVDVCARWRLNSRRLHQLPQARLVSKPACLSEICQIAGALGETERLHLRGDRSIAAGCVSFLKNRLLTSHRATVAQHPTHAILARTQ